METFISSPNLENYLVYSKLLDENNTFILFLQSYKNGRDFKNKDTKYQYLY